MGCSSSAIVEKSNFREAYRLQESLGSGAFGQVRAARSVAKGSRCAVKLVDLQGDNVHMHSSQDSLFIVDQKLLKKARSELNLWRQHVGKHPNCVELFEAFLERGCYYIVMELCSCTLMDKLDFIPKMSVASIMGYFRGMLLGASHLHRVDVVHRDLKPDNFLVSDEVVKIGDFGMAASLHGKRQLTAQCGTGPYMSPEMLRGNGYREKTDIWSLGVTAYVLLYNTFPYVPTGRDDSYEAMKQATLDAVLSPQYVRLGPQGAPKLHFDWAVGFISGLLEHSPLKRCSAGQALELPLFSMETTCSSENVTAKTSSSFSSCTDELDGTSSVNTKTCSSRSSTSTDVGEFDSQSDAPFLASPFGSYDSGGSSSRLSM